MVTYWLPTVFKPSQVGMGCGTLCVLSSTVYLPKKLSLSEYDPFGSARSPAALAPWVRS